MSKSINPWNLAAARGHVATTPLEAQTYTETAFRGVDYRTHPDRLAPGMARQVINGFPDGPSGIVGRGAFVGQLTAPLAGGPLWTLLSVSVGAVTFILFVQGGKLWRHQVGTSSCTEVLQQALVGSPASFSFPEGGERVQLVRHGAYVYISGGWSGGGLYRIDVRLAGTWVARRWGGALPAPTLEWTGTTTTVSSGEGRLATAQAWVVTTTNEPFFSGWPLSSGILSAPSNAIPEIGLGSALIVPTLDTATLKVTLPPGASGVTNFLFWRQDTTFADGRYRLVDAQGLSSVSGGNWTWNSGTQEGLWRDEFAADDLIGRPTLDIGELLSTTRPIASLTAHNGRLWAAQGNTLYASWLLDYDPLATDSGLVWTSVPDENDPAREAKGASFTIGGDGDSDTIVALSQAQADTAAGDYGDVLIAFRQSAHTFISGDSPETWRASTSRVGEHYGCLSPRAIANVEGSWVYQSPRGAQALVTNGSPRFLGEVDGQFPMEPYLSQDAFPALLGATYSATEYRRISYLAYDRRLWVFTSSAQNNPASTQGWVWAWSGRTDGWSFLASYGFTGGVVLSTQNDTGQLYLAGRDGQLYRYDPTARLDKPTPTHPGNAYDLTLVSRNHGAEGGSARFSPARPVALRVDVTCETASSYLSWDVVPGDNPDHLSAASWSRLLPQGRNVVELSAPADVRGYSHAVSLKLTNAGPGTRLSGYQLTCVEQGAKRV